ncbi:TIGR04348 family glycosyltransferase [Polaromonas sp. P2-4]|nr:TIGR04348 family glycosyltransferase [Polaromonas sp. P2-4]
MAESNNGNWHTAHRWAQFLSGHCDIALQKQWPLPHGAAAPAGTPQAMIALHARRSADSIRAWAEAYPDKPLIVVLTGTDLYHDIHSDAAAQQSLALASHLVVLQQEGLAELPQKWRSKTLVIYQSAPALKPAHKSSHSFRAVMVGHLREEKARSPSCKRPPATLQARIYFDQIGEALEPRFAEAAQATERRTPHYHWLGGLTRAATRQRIKRAHVLVNCSQMEGGAQVILEAVQSGTPVLASRVSGNLGMLGTDYAGYFALGDDAGLAGLVRRCAAEPDFLDLLQRQCRQRAHLFDPLEEKRLVINLVASALNRTARP